MAQQRIHIFVEGKVQGVSFRSHTQKVALKHDVTGWVKNLSDGRVEALFEGDEENLGKVITRCLSGPERSVVQKVVVIKEPVQNEFDQFSIVFPESGATNDFQQPRTDSIERESALIREHLCQRGDVP
jgi:acylphosphatase